MSKMKMDNARNPHQLNKMRICLELGRCPFCKEYLREYHDEPIKKEGNYWTITANDYPYDGTKYHFLVISKRHIVLMSDLLVEEWAELFEMVKWLQDYLEVSGFSFFARNGDMKYTGATLDHLHFHFLVGGEKLENGKLENNILVTLGHKNRPRAK